MLSNSRKYNHCWPEYRNGPPCGWWRLVGVCLCRPSLQSPAPSAESSRSQPPAAARIINNTLVPLSVLFHLRCAATCHGTKFRCKVHSDSLHPIHLLHRLCICTFYRHFLRLATISTNIQQHIRIYWIGVSLKKLAFSLLTSITYNELNTTLPHY